jgi:peptidoglycan/xylan/chitin deacetylase (PgdA/CDA1 family)
VNLVTLIYHDVLPAGGGEASGRPGPGAALYKLDTALFAAHLAALAGVAAAARRDWRSVLADPEAPAVLLTFDDGGASASRHVAPLLEAQGWRGHFFVTTRALGTPGFLTAAELRDLAARGHVVGTHSASHPDRFAAQPAAAQTAEWRESTARLADILGAPVTVGSVPGGLFDARVAAVAADAGLTALFTSEPHTRLERVGSCAVLGRYSVVRRTSAAEVAGLVAGSGWRRQRQALAWSLKRAIRTVGGEPYLRARRRLLGGLTDTRDPDRKDDR